MLPSVLLDDDFDKGVNQVAVMVEGNPFGVRFPGCCLSCFHVVNVAVHVCPCILPVLSLWADARIFAVYLAVCSVFHGLVLSLRVGCAAP